MEQPKQVKGRREAVARSAFSSSSYLMQHGWQGAGVPLDGKQGKGLKKPLAIPQKRDVKGIGKNRDRAVEWWDCIFEASAKSLSSARATTPTAKSPDPKAAHNASGLSLTSLAKREHARKLLMNGFIRGEVIGGEDHQVHDSEKRRLENADTETSKTPLSGAADCEQSTHEERRPSREERKAAKLAKRAARNAKRSATGAGDSGCEGTKTAAKKRKRGQ